MARPVRPELLGADYELGRFIRYQHDAVRLGYPKCSAFAKDIARGAVGTAPTPQDPVMDVVGAFYWQLKEIRRRVAADRYIGEGTAKERARRLSMSVRQREIVIERILIELKGWLGGVSAVATARAA